jgi:hypothetical protein
MYKFILALFLLFSSSETPSLNTKVVKYVDSVIGKTVGRGECWDLAAAALNYAGAYLDRSNEKTIYVFGSKLNPDSDEVFPGDILQIENATMEYAKDNAIYTENMSHHTAIVYKVLAKRHYKIAHQNTSFSGRKVGVSELNLDHVKKGKIIFYRPLPK